MNHVGHVIEEGIFTLSVIRVEISLQMVPASPTIAFTELL